MFSPVPPFFPILDHDLNMSFDAEMWMDLKIMWQFYYIIKAPLGNVNNKSHRATKCFPIIPSRPTKSQAAEGEIGD